MKTELTSAKVRLIALAGLAFVYLAVFPDDIHVVTAPIASFSEAIATPVTNVLEMSRAASAWLYIVAGVCIIAWAAVRIWGERPARRSGR